MKNAKIIFSLSIVAISSLLLSACGKQTGNAGKNVSFSNDDEIVEEVETYTDKFATAKVEFRQSYDLKQNLSKKLLLLVKKLPMKVKN